jgi:hypothetical protein
MKNPPFHRLFLSKAFNMKRNEKQKKRLKEKEKEEKQLKNRTHVRQWGVIGLRNRW